MIFILGIKTNGIATEDYILNNYFISLEQDKSSCLARGSLWW